MKTSVCAVLATVAGLAAVAANAGPERITFPAGFERWERYGVVDRHDSKQYRELYARPEVVKAVREGKPVPDGAVLAMAIFNAQVDAQGAPLKDANGRFLKGTPVAVTVMEKRKGWGAEYPAEMRNGEWEYASFLPDGRPNEKANAGIKACFMCHKPHEKQDFVISLASLAGKMPTAAVAKRSGAQDVNITGFAFGPGKLEARAGQPITWTNADDSPHQVEISGKGLKTAVLLKGQSDSLTIAEPGTYNYVCPLHPAMKGTIEVR